MRCLLLLFLQLLDFFTQTLAFFLRLPCAEALLTQLGLQLLNTLLLNDVVIGRQVCTMMC